LGTCSRIATDLDAEMLVKQTTIAPIGTDPRHLPLVRDLEDQLGGRYLMRYLLASQLGTLTSGTTLEQFVTPTAYSPEETITWLTLPPSAGFREWVLLLDPASLTNVYGPRWVRLGGGIEYILASGFAANAVVDAAPGPRGSSRWEIQIR
jgi:hypothetical protein